MKDLHEFLSERELFVIENHPEISYAKIGERFGITGNRVAQIKAMALRKIRDEKRREEAWKRGQQKVDYALTRSQCYLVIRALGEYALYLTPSNIRATVYLQVVWHEYCGCLYHRRCPGKEQTIHWRRCTDQDPVRHADMVFPPRK